MDIFRQHQFRQPIFQVQVDPVRPALAVECRDAKSQTVSFGLLDLKTGAWKSCPKNFPWWTGLSLVCDGHLILEDYAEKTLPVRQGVKVISTEGEILWENPVCKLLGPGLAGPLLMDQHQHPFLLARESGGQFRRQPLTDTLKQDERNRYLGWEREQLRFPSPQAPHGPSWETWFNTNPPVQQPFPVLTIGAWTLGAWHQATESGYTLFLGASHVSRHAHQWILETEMAAMHPEPFFVYGQRVICTLNRNTLAWSEPVGDWPLKG